MRVRMLSLLAGPNGSHQIGSTLTGTEDELRPLVEQGYAVECDEQGRAMPETATAEAPENAAKTKATRRQAAKTKKVDESDEG